MRIMVIGLGYVGSVTSAGLAHSGHQVTGVDIDAEKVKAFLENGNAIKEPGLSEIIMQAIKNNNLTFRHISNIDVIDDQIVFICVGTPTKLDGSVDLSQVISVISWIKEKTKNPVTIVMKSTVPPGTGNNIIKNYLDNAEGKYSYVMNPEFLQEGQALKNWFHPDRTVIGCSSNQTIELMKKLYESYGAPILITDITTAEMIKYAANAFLATKISFINEIAKLCEGVNADIDTVAKGIGLDKRIGQSFLRAGIGYGGSCFPKDTKALEAIFASNGLNFGLLKAVIEVNNNQRFLAVNKLKAITGELKGKKIAVLGLAFKPNTDDIREAPAIDIVKLLYTSGAEVHTYDPIAISNATRVLPKEIKYFDSSIEALKDVNGAILVTEWPEFINLDWAYIKTIMKEPYAIVDGRNCLDAVQLTKLGFKYKGFGRYSK